MAQCQLGRLEQMSLALGSMAPLVAALEKLVFLAWLGLSVGKQVATQGSQASLEQEAGCMLVEDQQVPLVACLARLVSPEVGRMLVESWASPEPLEAWSPLAAGSARLGSLEVRKLEVA